MKSPYLIYYLRKTNINPNWLSHIEYEKSSENHSLRLYEDAGNNFLIPILLEDAMRDDIFARNLFKGFL